MSLLVSVGRAVGVATLTLWDNPLAGLGGGLVGSGVVVVAGGGVTGVAGLFGRAGPPLCAGLSMLGLDLDFALSMVGFGIVGGFLPWEVLEPVDPMRPMGASRPSDPADPTRSMGVSEPGCAEEMSSESDTLKESAEASLTALPVRPTAETREDSASSLNSAPLVGGALGFIEMMMLSGPLESELPLMNIFWCVGGGEMVTGEEDCGRGWGEWEEREGFGGAFSCSSDC